MPTQRALAAIVLGVLGCEAAPDVVAEQPEPDAAPSAFSTSGVTSCRAGHYVGAFSGVFRDGAQPLAGTIDFALVARLEAEFLQLQTDSVLQGVAGTAPNTIPFSSEIHGGEGCDDRGQIITYLTNGVFTFGMNVYGFSGEVHGFYQAEGCTFGGTWVATLDDGSLLGTGMWNALLVPSSACPDRRAP